MFDNPLAKGDFDNGGSPFGRGGYTHHLVPLSRAMVARPLPSTGIEPWLALDSVRMESAPPPAPPDLDSMRTGLGVTGLPEVVLVLAPRKRYEQDGAVFFGMPAGISRPRFSLPPLFDVARERGIESANGLLSGDIRAERKIYSIRNQAGQTFALLTESMHTDAATRTWHRQGTVGTPAGLPLLRTAFQCPTNDVGFPDKDSMRKSPDYLFFKGHLSVQAGGTPMLAWAARIVGARLFGVPDVVWDLSIPGRPPEAQVTHSKGSWEIKVIPGGDLFDPVLHCISVREFSDFLRNYLMPVR